MFAGKTAIVTGAANGIGHGIAQYLLKSGAAAVFGVDVTAKYESPTIVSNVL